MMESKTQGLNSTTTLMNMLYSVLQIFCRHLKVTQFSDLLKKLANQKLCYIQIYKICREEKRNVFGNTCELWTLYVFPQDFHRQDFDALIALSYQVRGIATASQNVR